MALVIGDVRLVSFLEIKTIGRPRPPGDEKWRRASMTHWEFWQRNAVPAVVKHVVIEIR
jgi:hypothetical protein